MAKITTTTEDREEFIKLTGSTLTSDVVDLTGISTVYIGRYKMTIQQSSNSDIVDLTNHGSENDNYIAHFPETGGVAIFEKFPNNVTKGKC